MKKIFFMVLSFVAIQISFAQTYTSNVRPIGLEHNVLFNATTRYTVVQDGSASLDLSRMFDGKFVPSYTSVAPTSQDPTVILIKGLPNWHSQKGAWVGWSTRYWQAKRFKIEGFNSYKVNEWVTIADYSSQDYTGGTDFIQKVPSGSYTELRFTFYAAVGSNGRLGVSELFYLAPEIVTPYQGLFDNIGGNWDKSGSNISYASGNVGIGTTNTKGFKLGVNGKIAASEVKVATYVNWADFVFSKEYKLPSLNEVEAYIIEKGHLQNIPSAEEVKRDGFFLGEMDAKLLQKIEELTLYTIQQEKKLDKQAKEIETLKLLVKQVLEKKE